MSHPPRPRPAIRPLDESEIDALQVLLDAVPAPLEPLDVSMLDGFLCGVIVQPQPIPPAHWLPRLTDAEGRALPPSFDVQRRLHALARRRHTELEDAIAQRRWFDPWVFELESDSGASGQHAEGEPLGVREAVYPWVGGFATALELFPGLMGLDERALLEPLSLLYQYLEPDDLEDADALLEEIESLEPPSDLAEAVEDLVRATLLLADVSRPRRESSRPSHPRRRIRR